MHASDWFYFLEFALLQLSDLSQSQVLSQDLDHAINRLVANLAAPSTDFVCRLLLFFVETPDLDQLLSF